MELDNNTIWERCNSKSGKAPKNLKKVQTKGHEKLKCGLRVGE
jgi:hypothetical protein